MGVPSKNSINVRQLAFADAPLPPPSYVMFIRALARSGKHNKPSLSVLLLCQSSQSVDPAALPSLF